MQAPQYGRDYPQTQQRSPHAAQARRGPGPMIANAHPPPPLSTQQMQAQAQQEAQRRELARRQSRKPTDRNVPDGVEEITIGDGVLRYKNMQELERKLDAVMMRKRLDMNDSLLRYATHYRTLRIWVSNTAENQPWQQTGIDPESFDFSSDNQATYRVKIEGRLLEEDDDQLVAEAAARPAQDKDSDAMETDGDNAQKAKKSPPVPGQRTRLSHFFKQIVINFDRSKSLQPDGFTQIEWKKPVRAPNMPPDTSDEMNFDVLEFERKADDNINVTINLVRDDEPERYKLSEPLAELLDTEEDDRASIILKLWSYIKANNLQEDEETRRIHCDPALRRVFNTETILFPHLPELLSRHVTPLAPLPLPYTIRVDKAYISPPSDAAYPPSQPTIYDIKVQIPDPFPAQLKSTLKGTNSAYTQTLQQIVGLNEQIALAVQAIGQSKAKHAFYTSLAKDPARFINRWVGSQRRDLEVILGEARSMGASADDGTSEEWRKGGETGVWGGEIARESVGLWLARQGRAH